MRRWLGAVLSMVIMSAVPTGALTPAAQAAPAARGDGTREVIVKPREPRPDVFFITGRVRPDYARKPAILQRRNCADCAWFAFDRFRTDDAGRFKRPIPVLEPDATRVCYRVKVPGGRGFEAALSASNCVGLIA